MEFCIAPIAEVEARAVVGWRYTGPLAIYNCPMEEAEATVRTMLDPATPYYAAHDATGALAGFCCFGADARVPGGDYADDTALDVGLGLRPDLAGRGLGPAFVDAIVSFAQRQFHQRRFRLTVAAWNRRAIRAYETAGFIQTHTFARSVPAREPLPRAWVQMTRDGRPGRVVSPEASAIDAWSRSWTGRSDSDERSMKPDFSAFRPMELRNVKTGELAHLVRADTVEVSSDLVDQVTRICNEPLIYDFLFRRGLHGAPYPPEKAREFLDQVAHGWQEQTHFVFFIVLPDGHVAGNVEIESPDLDAADIGYWASTRHPGFMTPAMAAVCDVARAAGYRSLYAHTRTYNERSMAVLRRNGFADVGLAGSGDDLARKFVKAL
jgi:[ribosomal protein S18]-alanine N-acetyltransferase